MDDVRWCRRDGDGLVLTLRAAPGARRSEVAEAGPDRLRVRLAAPAVEGKANAELIRFVAEVFGVRRSAVELVVGARGREKQVRVRGATALPADLRSGRGGGG